MHGFPVRRTENVRKSKQPLDTIGGPGFRFPYCAA